MKNKWKIDLIEEALNSGYITYSKYYHYLWENTIYPKISNLKEKYEMET